MELPGLAEQHATLKPSNYRVEVLPCTSDAPVSKRHQMLIERGAAYAAAYNKAMVAAVGTTPLFDLPIRNSK
jgi:hypothetical protein